MSSHRNPWLALLLLPAAFLAARAELSVGDPFPALGEFGLVGGDLPATAGKVVLVDFWASWCAPCKASFPSFAKLHQEFAGAGFAIIAVSVDEKPAAFAAFVRKMNPPFVVLHDPQQKLVTAVRVPAMPTSYLLDRRGRVRFIHQGFHAPETGQDLRRELAALLAEKE